MAEEIKQEYIPPTYGALFMDTYLKSHRQRMQTSLALAQQELRTDKHSSNTMQRKRKSILSISKVWEQLVLVEEVLEALLINVLSVKKLHYNLHTKYVQTKDNDVCILCLCVFR